MKQKKCAHCKTVFMPFRPLQKVCSPMCAASIVKVSREKQDRKDYREAKQKAKKRSEWLADAQKVFNQFIRLRDENNPCISCGRWHTGQWHAGHYRSVGSSPHLRFNEHNAHRQCQPCNHFLSGNIVNYRRGLIDKIGKQAVEQLEANQDIKKYTIDDIKQIIQEYKMKIKEMTQE